MPALRVRFRPLLAFLLIGCVAGCDLFQEEPEEEPVFTTVQEMPELLPSQAKPRGCANSPNASSTPTRLKRRASRGACSSSSSWTRKGA